MKNITISDQDNTTIIIAILVPSLLILIVALTILFVRKRRYSGHKSTQPGSNDNMSLPDSTIDTNRPILIKNFAEHYRLMSADSDFR